MVIPVIQTTQLTKAYGQRRGVSDVALTVQTGEIFGFLGPNGAGKSTTIRLLLGFLKASSGTARIFGKDCWHESAAIKQDVGYVAGDVRLYPWLTATKALQFVGDIRGTNLLNDGLLLAERFQLEPDVPVRKMSRGNRQKIALLMALVHRPQLIVLDEPTSGLDPLVQETLGNCLQELAAAGHTVFLSSHTLSEVETLCTQVAIVREGRIVANEQIAAMKKRAPRSAIVTLKTEAATESVPLPDCVMLKHRAGAELHLQLTGAALELAKWAASHPVVDISIGAPNLESLFHEFYGLRESSGNDDACTHQTARSGETLASAEIRRTS